MKRILLSIVICLVCGVVNAQTKTPKYSNEFLNLGAGARGIAMSGAFTSQTNDATSGYWNPAGLTSLAYKYDVSLMHSQYFAGIANYDYIGFATKIDTVSTLGVSVIRFGVDDIPDTRFLYDANGALNYDNIKFFSAVDYGFLLSYARKVKALGGISIGGNVKIIHRSAGAFAKAWGFGIDLGIQKKMKNFNLALMVKDITGTYNTWSHNTSLIADIYTQTGNKIPENSIEITLPRAIFGFSYIYTYKEKLSLLAAVDMEMTFDGQRNTPISSSVLSIDPKLGLELAYVRTIFLRFGVGQFQQIKDFDKKTYLSLQPTFGLGVVLKNVSIDYALTDLGNQAVAPYSNIISLKIGLDDKK